MLDPASPPSLSSLSVIKTIKEVKVLVVSVNGSGKSLAAGGVPVFNGSKGDLMTNWRIGATPTFYLVDRSGKITNVWYGFDKHRARRFATEVSDAVSDLSADQ